MASITFNAALGRTNELVRRVVENDPANSALIVVLLKVTESDVLLKDYDDLGALIAGANTEADFTNYARVVLTDADLATPVPDDGSDFMESLLTLITYVAAGGALNNSLVKAIICYDSDTGAGTDANIIPLTAHDMSLTTDGNNFRVEAGAFFRAS